MLNEFFNFVDPIKYDLITAAVIFLSSFVIANLLAYIINKRLSKDSIIKKAKFFSATFVRLMLPFVGLLIAVKHIRYSLRAKGILEYEPTFLLLENIIFVIAIGFASYISFKAFVFFFHKYISGTGEEAHIDANFTSLLSKVLKLIIFIVAVIIVLDRFGVNINSFIVSLGIGSLAIALAAQETLANIIAGIVILVDRPFIIGEKIRTNSGTVGTVEQIGIRSCRITTLDGKILVVPNTELTKSSITNLSYDSANYKIRFAFTVPFDMKVEDVKNKISSNIVKCVDILDNPKPSFVFNTFNPNSYELIFICWCKNDDSKNTDNENAAKECVLTSLTELGITDYLKSYS
jgi:small-conductance mechanosensitive channel